MRQPSLLSTHDSFLRGGGILTMFFRENLLLDVLGAVKGLPRCQQSSSSIQSAGLTVVQGHLIA